nr:Mur ligase family protein [Planctomycetota bacterium]
KAKIFIVEMGAYQRGDIKTICDLVKPNYSILTGINEAHLERFGNLQNTIKAKYELAEATSDLALLNFSDKNIKENVGFFKIKKYQGVSSELVSDIKIKENFLGLEFTYRQQKFSTVLLAKHNIDLIILSVELALSLGLDLPTIAEGVSKVEVVEHRLQPIFNPYTKVVVIDDSYNGNYAGFLSGLEVLSRASGRKIVLTPGLVELGKESEKIHRQLAHVYAEQKIDQVLLIKNSATIYIKEEFDKIGFKNYFLYNSTLEAHNNLKEILKTGDTIIFQNDWPDNYN